MRTVRCFGCSCLGNCSAAVACPAGTALASAGAIVDTACQVCAARRYAFIWQSCVGVLTHGPPAQACAPGDYALAGSVTCTPCPVGFECPTTSSSPSLCPGGTFSAGQVTACSACPAGYACTQGLAPSSCHNGSYSPAGMTPIDILTEGAVVVW